MVILSVICKPENFELHNSLKLSFTNIQGLCLNFIDANLSINQTLVTLLLYVKQIWMTQLILETSSSLLLT